MSLPNKGTGFGAMVAIIALCIQISGLLWIGGRRTQQIDSLLDLASDAKKRDSASSAHVQEMQTQITVLQQQVMALQNMLRELQARLEAKKIVNIIGDSNPISKVKEPKCTL